MPIDELLKKELKAAKKAPRNFALVVSAKPGLIVSRTKIGGAAVKNKQKECGGGMVLRGRCFGEDGLLVFETTIKPAGGLAAKVKQLVKKSTGLTLKVELRQKEKVEEIEAAPEVDDTDDDDDKDSEESSEDGDDGDSDGDGQVESEKAGALLATLKDRLKTLLPRIVEAKRYAPDQQDDLDELVQQATTAAKAGKGDELEAALTELHELTNRIWKAGPQDHVTTVLKQRLRVLLPGYQRAVELQPDSKSELDKLIADATKAAKAGKLEQTTDLLDNLEADIQVMVEGGGDPEKAAAEFDKRLAALQGSYDKALALTVAAKTGKDAELRQQHAKVVQLRKDKDLAGALEELDALAGLVKSSLRAAVAKQEVREAVGAGLVKTRPILVRWNQGLNAAGADLDRLVSETLSHPDVVDDPRFPEIAKRVRQFPSALPDFGNKLEASLELIQRSKPEDRDKAVKLASKVVDEYAAKIDKTPLLKELENTMFGKYRIHAALAAALKDMKQLLAS
jgi:hypothetical protein